MKRTDGLRCSASPPPIYLVSGGTGASGEQVVHTVLAQFPDVSVPVITTAHVRQEEQLAHIVEQAAASGGMVVHTMVDGGLRRALTRLAQARGVAAIDLMGDLLTRLADVLEERPLGRPGLYRQLHQAYFDRVAAIEFSVAHDDGMNPEGWPAADVVLVGVSRVGKTPLSMYMGVLGWRVANVPIVVDLGLPAALFQLDRRRVVGLHMEAGQLLFHRQERRRRLHAPGLSGYTDPALIREELEVARRAFQRGGFSVVDVTDKPIEASADEIAGLISRRFADKTADGQC